MSASRPELLHGTVLRLARRPASEQFTADRRSPQAQDFALGSNELIEAANKGYGQLSVYDSALTTPAQARALMERPDDYRLVFTLDVAGILAIPFNLHVYRDPNPNGPRPGAEGHCVIENVWSADKHRIKDIRAELMRIAAATEPIDM